jgi:hypothetical protein
LSGPSSAAVNCGASIYRHVRRAVCMIVNLEKQDESKASA